VTWTIEENEEMANERKSDFPMPQALSLLGRRALVTGAASGIGYATAKCLAELGADLVLADRAPMEQLREEIETMGRRVTTLEGDLTDDAFLQRIISSGPYFSFAYVAGVFKGPHGPQSKESFDFVMQVNVRAPMILGLAFIENASPTDGGYMVFVGSSAGRSGKGRLGEPIEYATYASSKGAVHSLTRALASRGAEKNILVNGIAPGVVRTPMLDATAPHLAGSKEVSTLGRSADPMELGWPIAFLCSPGASFISGAVLDVNGGAFVG
jgi:3-oxoacyl-[acyl-carrier protein] reductase